jgi:hypothetical protein
MRALNGVMNKRAVATTSGSVFEWDERRHIPNEPNLSNKTKEAEPHVAIPVPFVAQQHGNMCGDACVNMLYLFMGEQAPQDMGVNPRGIFEGLDIQDANLDTLFWKIDDPNPERRLAYVLLKYGPIIASGSFARFMGGGANAVRPLHKILVNGVWDETVLINDPWHGEDRQKPIDWFIKHLTDCTDHREAMFYYFKGAGDVVYHPTLS